MTAQELSVQLEKSGIKPSQQRLKIAEYLDRNRVHPTADEIHKALQPEMPTLSLTTVYNTLKLFVMHSFVQALTIESEEMRYDLDTSPHGHFQCDSCQKVYDFSLKGHAEPAPLAGFTVRQRHLYYRGLCPHCSSRH